jgi:hypothetical protein
LLAVAGRVSLFQLDETEFFLFKRLSNQGQDKILIFYLSFSSDTPSHPFAGLGLFHPLFLARLVVDRMPFNLFDDCFLLDPSFESFKSAFNRLAFFNNDKRQKYSPPYSKMKFISESLGLVKQMSGSCQARVRLASISISVMGVRVEGSSHADFPQRLKIFSAKASG